MARLIQPYSDEYPNVVKTEWQARLFDYLVKMLVEAGDSQDVAEGYVATNFSLLLEEFLPQSGELVYFVGMDDSEDPPGGVLMFTFD